MGIGSALRRLFGLAAPEGEPSCVVCGSAELEALGPDAYRCAACRHEGGDGYGELLVARRRARARARPVHDVRRDALDVLEGARLTLVATLDVPEPGVGWMIGSALAHRTPIGAGIDEEYERLRRDREEGIAKARAELLPLRPLLEVLVEKGLDLWRALADLDVVASEESPPEQLLAFIAATSAALSR
ncbi:MAG: hypothetical protein KC635_14600 [Myxococcales bacterium]|nr:hypothetical protein [Myxococcales bacterium]